MCWEVEFVVTVAFIWSEGVGHVTMKNGVS